MKRNVGRNNQADAVIEVPCCVMCTAVHPENATLIVGGLFNGELRVWDTALLESSDQEQEALLMSSTIDDFYHREPITQVAWVRDIRERSYNIVSVSGDGKVLFFDVNSR